MSRSRSVLGRGLEALITGAESTTTRTKATGVVEIPLAQLQPNPLQPRQHISTEELEELAASIRAHGVIQPLIVTRVDEGYQIITGERRWRAAQLAGLESVPAIVKETTPREMLELALVENIQRADLNPLEEASAYQQLMDEFQLTQEEVAAQVGKSRVAVANTVRLLKLPSEVKQALTVGEISEGHARALLALPTVEQQLHALATIRRSGLTVRQTEALVRALQTQPDKDVATSTERCLSPQDRYVVERFEEHLGTRVELLRGRKGGRLVIHFYSDEELQAIYQTVAGKTL